MKVYLHSDDPVLTVVVAWDDNNAGTIKNILDIFCDSLFQKFPTTNRNVTFTLSTAKGKQLDHHKKILQNIKNRDDLFVKINHSSEIVSQVCEEMEATSISPSHAKDDKRNIVERNKIDNTKDLEGKRNAALIHMSNQRYRKAINIYKEMYALDKSDLSAIKGLVTCYLRANRFKDAVVYCKVALTREKEDIETLALAGECYVKVGDGEAAIEHLLKLCKILREKGVTSAAEKQNILVLLAKAYLIEDQKDMAITVLQGVLRENVDHTDALAEYAPLLFCVGGPEHKKEAISAILTALVQRGSDKYIKQKFAEIMTTKDGLHLLKNVAANVLTDASALMFLAISLREFGAIEQTLELLELALKAEQKTVCMLTYIHTLELVERQADALNHLLQFCKMFPDKGVGNLRCLDLIPYLEALNEDLTDTKAPCSDFECKTGVTPVGAYKDEDLYILAVFFTVVKILYVKGLLKLIPPLLQLIQPFCVDRELHLTVIRNEAAFFKCIHEVFNDFPREAVTNACITQGQKYLYFIGDSHCIPVAWNKTSYKGEEFTLYPVLSTGTKIWHLRPESVFYPKTNFKFVIENIPDEAVVAMCLGEIDCREAFLQCWEKAKYDTIEEAMEAVVQIYIALLRDLQTKHAWTIFVHPVLPVIDPTRPIVMQFNRILATRLLKEPSLKWLNFVNDLFTTPDGSSLKDEYKLDGTHMHPRYLRLFTDALNQHE